MMASIFSAAMILRARSIRAARSAAVIGFAAARIEASAAILGVSGPPGASLPRPRCADRRVTDKPAAAPVNDRKERRVNISQSPINNQITQLLRISILLANPSDH